MSVRRESDCVGCDLPCLGKSCPHYEIEIKECDLCHNVADELYTLANGTEVCEDCYNKVNEE